MLSNAVLTKVKTTYTPDGQGGYTQETVEEGTYDVQLSVSDNVEEATAYGVSVEEVLKVVSDVPLLDDEAGLYILKGADGVDGKDGTVDFSNLTDEQKQAILDQLNLTEAVSPTIETSKTDGVTTLTITDVNGTKTATINDGAKGDTGDTGPQGEQGIQGEQGEKGDTGATPDITMTASVDNTSSTTPTVTVTKGGTAEEPTFDLAFKGLKGAAGSGSGGSSVIDVTGSATVDDTTGTPAVSVTASTTDNVTNLAFAFTGLKGEKGDTGAQGEKGDTGAQGAQGEAGTSATVSIGTVSTLEAGSSATVTNTGTDSAAVFNFGIPKGEKGDTGAQGEKGDTGAQGEAGTSATIEIGTVTTLDEGAEATVTNSGTSSAVVLNFGIPKGATGAQGEKGETGATGSTYTLTDDDKSAIATIVYNTMINAEEVSY